MEEKIYNFYVLSASSDVKNVRYVGVTTKTVQERFCQHKYCSVHSEKRGLPVHKWMWAHYEKGEKIIVTQIDSCLESEWEDREKYWITYYKDLGYDLKNISKGGKGVITKEMRSSSSIERSIKGHEKPIIALYKDGTFYKEFESAVKAAKELKLKSPSAIGNVLKGISKSSAGYLWVYKEDYSPDEIYSYDCGTNIIIYEFDIDGSLLNTYPSYSYFRKLKGWSDSGVRGAIKNKTIYHDHYWSITDSINIDEYETWYKYVEFHNDTPVAYYKTMEEIKDIHKLCDNTILKYITQDKLFPNGNTIIKV